MKPSLLAKLDQLANHLIEVDELLMQPDVASNQENYRKLSREHAELAPLVALYNEYKQAESDIETAQEMAGDPDMKEFAYQEIASARQKTESIEEQLQLLLLPKDPNDDRNIFLEIRAGTGGDESAIFAGDLLRMYTRFAERNRWQVEMVSASASEMGGYREVIVRIIGQGAYSKLKFESGGHRVQRVPVTETQGRIHTSACTVAIMPEADEVNDVDINPADLRIDTYRASGAGGQHINKTDSAVRITHLPTGIVVECQDDRNRPQANTAAVVHPDHLDRFNRTVRNRVRLLRLARINRLPLTRVSLSRHRLWRSGTITGPIAGTRTPRHEDGRQRCRCQCCRSVHHASRS